MTREQKIVKAKELRGKGWKASRIAEVVDAPESTVRNWYLGGECRCGAPLDGGSPSRGTERCRSCTAKDATIWTREWIVSKIQEWTSLYGEPPTAEDWAPQTVHSRRANAVRTRFYSASWPYTEYVQRRFGSWNAGIEAAGFTPRTRRGPDKVDKRRRRVAA